MKSESSGACDGNAQRLMKKEHTWNKPDATGLTAAELSTASAHFYIFVEGETWKWSKQG